MEKLKAFGNKIAEQFLLLITLTKRHFLVFFKNWVTVIFTMMVPIIILAVYILFLRDLELSSIRTALDGIEGLVGASRVKFETQVSAIVDSWMISGVLAVSCVTVSLNTCYILVRDKESGINRDFISSPIPQKTIMFSYFFFNMFVTFLINLLVLFICLIYLVAYGALMISPLDFFAIIGVLLLSTLNASLLTFFICSFINKDSVLSSIVAIASAAIGFLIGAYLPPNMLPDGVNALTTFFPGTYSAGLLRNYFMSTPIEKLISQPYVQAIEGLPEKIHELQDGFTLNISFYDYQVTPGLMAVVILVFSAIFLVLNLIFTSKNLFKFTKKNKRRTHKKEGL